jgi:hypothetical protein
MDRQNCQLLHADGTNEIAHGICRWHLACIFPQQERSLSLGLGECCRQMQHTHILAVCTPYPRAREPIVGPAKGQGGREIVARAIRGKGTWLAHQRPDDVTRVDRVLRAPM